MKNAFSNFQRVWTPRELVDVGLAKSSPTSRPARAGTTATPTTVLLGMIIEQVTGKKIQDLFAEKIFKPLQAARRPSWPTTSAMPSPYARGITVQTLDDRQDDATHRNPSWAFTAGAADLRRSPTCARGSFRTRPARWSRPRCRSSA